jgi:hypothetical protein
MEVLRHEQYGNADEPGEIIKFANGEYCQAESDSERSALAWSSTGPIAELLPDVVDVIGGPVSGASGTVIRNLSDKPPQILTGEASDVLGYVVYESTDISYVRVDLPDYTFRWRAPFAKFSNSSVEYAEASLSGADMRRDTIVSLLAKTATASIRQKTDAIFDSLELSSRLS